MGWWSTWPRAARLAAIVLLLATVVGWGMAIQRSGQLSETGQRLSAAEQESQSRQQRIQELELTLAGERQAAGDLASLTQRLDAAGAELGKAQQARADAEARSGELASTITTSEQHVAELQQQLTQSAAPGRTGSTAAHGSAGSERAGTAELGNAPGGDHQGRKRRCAGQGTGGADNRARRGGGRLRAAGENADRGGRACGCRPEQPPLRA